MNAAPTLEKLDPTTLTVDINVRKDAGLTKEFVASIKEHGVLVPVVAHRTEDGTVHVLMGQRRTLGAIEAGAATIPVLVGESPEEAERLATQVVENDHRSALTDGDRAEAFHQMSLLGVSASVIARKMGAKKALVETALKVKANATAAQALDQGLTLEQSAVIEEFADDADAVALLEQLATENPGNFAHRAQRLRDERRNNALLAEARAEATAKGLSVLDENPSYYDYKGPAATISALTTAEGDRLSDADADAAYIGIGYSGVVTILAVADWKARGLRKDGKAPAGGMTDEEKAARREVIENNKAMDSAEVVRRDFVKTLLARKAQPKNAQKFIAHTIAHVSYILIKALNKTEITAALLGTGTGYGEFKAYVDKPTTKPETVTLAMMITAYEANIDRTSWRSRSADTRYYLTQLNAWGYEASDVEKIILTDPKAETKETTESAAQPEAA
ncbi:ParB family chromosome partitioning protein [Paenarthrobacter nicotinovorans]|uniref:ParB/RepB/Spo0J family partition protein n=1 Tax=Paenarthrobacter nicotinovorans TaxID=29320 RepID=UPI0027899FB3|nr:ParB/RepB/Spo0J family partition protein [Paenarthrobacter nicotinovorans]MDP9936847.1 ParB family chromosome partitioning protein [Paenarthrobacter nicotinovorans]